MAARVVLLLLVLGTAVPAAEALQPPRRPPPPVVRRRAGLRGGPPRLAATAPVETEPANLKPYVSKLIEGESLSREECERMFGAFVDGSASAEQTAAILALLRQKGESPEEISGAAQAMLGACVPVAATGKLLDIVGTGGDGASTINLSTASAILCAALGAKTTKCGNRSVSSKCGAADVLEALGLDLELSVEAVARCIDDVGLGFLFAPKNHPGMRHVAPTRKALGVRTAFNILGPLTNAAGAQHVVLGVFDERLVDLMAGALERLGRVDHAVVVHGVGLDELSPLGPCTVVELTRHASGSYTTTKWTLDPLEDLGVPRCTVEDLRGGDAAFNAQALRDCLAASDDRDAKRDAIALNAAMGLYVYGAADSLKAGLDMAYAGLRLGVGLDKLDAWIAKTNELKALDAAAAAAA
eukprot:CAMPEP_0185703072 /NCGR_PEP_ID=MMETSP1164-20130828/13577_1 /TAXON_ID=1104430 /ORGANISM="Chrysoreinhardia sp, Strain CCMP2950" /LENGTH=412 /DNA_ID=CAMNT_0028370339 /DNA_START=20 /DNA_END=1258 /DNA_ORIENTATION=-